MMKMEVGMRDKNIKRELMKEWLGGRRNKRRKGN